jgi:hypothetical protein
MPWGHGDNFCFPVTFLSPQKNTIDEPGPFAQGFIPQIIKFLKGMVIVSTKEHPVKDALLCF